MLPPLARAWEELQTQPKFFSFIFCSSRASHLEPGQGSSLSLERACVCVCVCIAYMHVCCMPICVCVCVRIGGLKEVRHGGGTVIEETFHKYISTIRKTGFFNGFGDCIPPILEKLVRDTV